MLGIGGEFWNFCDFRELRFCGPCGLCFFVKKLNGIIFYIRYKTENVYIREALEIRLTTYIDKCRVAAHKILNIRAHNNKIFIYYIIKKEYLLWLEFLVMLCLLY